MTMVRQFRDLPDPCDRFDELFRAALKTLLDDLASAPWYVREREVVNLFVFGHLVREFQNADLDIRQISIEMPVLKLPRDNATNLIPQSMKPRETRSKYADIVVWPHIMATRWLTCKPLVQHRMEKHQLQRRKSRRLGARPQEGYPCFETQPEFGLCELCRSHRSARQARQHPLHPNCRGERRGLLCRRTSWPCSHMPRKGDYGFAAHLR